MIGSTFTENFLNSGILQIGEVALLRLVYSTETKQVNFNGRKKIFWDIHKNL